MIVIFTLFLMNCCNRKLFWRLIKVIHLGLSIHSFRFMPEFIEVDQSIEHYTFIRVYNYSSQTIVS